ncbi:DUF424 family protein, partial [Candidatus Micrarchaeota archaeon]|nr:DUF424 family protein [Candidatus Micrarchaeota archaeon]
ELLGKVFVEGEAMLDLETYREFYAGGEATEEDVGKALEKFSSANLVGKKCIKVAIESGLARETDVRYINNVPHLQIYRI